MTAELATRRPGRPKSLTREQIVEAALELAGTRGFAAVSMRNLGTSLGVRPATLYAYFAGKDELVVAVLARVFSPLLEPPPAGDWREQLTADMRRYAKVLADNPALINPALRVHGRLPVVGSAVERWLDLLETGGYEGPDAAERLVSMTSLAFGLAANLAAYDESLTQDAAASLSPRAAALLTEDPRELLERAFESGLARLLT